MAHRFRTADKNTPAARARARDYASPAHKAARRAGQIQVDAGHAHCWRCGKHLPPGSKWHVGHNDDRTRIMGTECVPCNLRAAARAGNAKQRATRGQRTQRRHAHSRIW